MGGAFYMIITKCKQKEPPKKKSDKPLTETQKKAREIAAESGLLALSEELSDLMDTSDITQMVGGKVISNTASASLTASPDTELLLAEADQGSGGVNENEYTTIVGRTALLSREVTRITQPLAGLDNPDQASEAQEKTRDRVADARREEDITLIFDRNKGKLYSVYNRALRKNSGLKGKIILQLTIAPNGKVISIKVISSELNDPKLESGLVSRIKLFNFGAKNVEQMTVTYPIEFLPS
jgi:protein TonB